MVTGSLFVVVLITTQSIFVLKRFSRLTNMSMSDIHAKPSLFVIVPGFGAPHCEEKLRILRKNIECLHRNHAFSKIHIRVCCYDPNSIAKIDHDMWQYTGIEWIVKKGIVGEYIHKYATPVDVKDYDYVMILLDDVELMEDVDMAQMILYQKQLRLDILTPCMTTNSKFQYQYMLHQPSQPFQLKIVAACEAFCYFMPVDSYLKYHAIIEPEDNPWLWGLDLVLYKYHQFHIAVLNTMQMHHHYKGECYAMRQDKLPTEGYNSVLRKYNANSQEFEQMQAVLFFVFVNSGL
jgi:hypothetical protein